MGQFAVETTSKIYPVKTLQAPDADCSDCADFTIIKRLERRFWKFKLLNKFFLHEFAVRK
jgi:hypothetical protein